MKTRVIMVIVSSINGLITRQNDPNIYSWTSKEDFTLFRRILGKSDAIIMGSGTYLANQSKIRPSQKHPRFVLTNNPTKFSSKQISGKLEFVSQDPTSLIQSLKPKCKIISIVGGSQINTLFLKENLVDELHLTIEPKLFGYGKNLLSPLDLDISAKLIKVKRLNQQGTIHLIYKLK